MTRFFAAACMVVGAVLDGLADMPTRFIVAEGGHLAADVVVPDGAAERHIASVLRAVASL